MKNSVSENLRISHIAHGRYEFGGVTVDETVGCCHVKDKFAANELGGGVVGTGAEQILEPDVSSTQQRRRTRIRFGTNRRRLLSG